MTAEAVRVAEALTHVLPPALLPLFDLSFCHSGAFYEEYLHRLVLEVFRNAGLEAAARETGDAAAISARAGLGGGPAVMAVQWMLRHLTARGLIDATPGGSYQLRQPLPSLDPGAIAKEQQAHDASWLPSYVLAEVVARDYPAFLRGERTGEEILFSPTRFQLWVNYFSNDNGLYAVNNRVGAVAVEAWLPRGDASILELGGGLASGAVAVLDRLDGDGRLGEIREYRFTELVPHFLRRGQRTLQSRFPDAKFLTFGRLDMNRSFQEQDVAPASLTAVYAVNTLHVAHDLDATLAEIREALAPGGRLIVSECVRPRAGQPIYPEFIFNLMEAFRAPLLRSPHRPNGGFLTPEQWTGVLKVAGFTDVQLLPDLIRIREEFPGFYVAAIGATRS